MRIFAISGSLRARSSNTELLRAAAMVAPPSWTFDLYDGLGRLPHFNPDLDAEGSTPPEPVHDLRARVAAADAVLICSPEYAHGVPGSLKNALDWLVSAQEPIGKPVLLVSASPGGAHHAHAQLLEVLRTMSLRVVDGGAHVYSRAKLDAAGDVADEPLLSGLRDGLAQLTGG